MFSVYILHGTVLDRFYIGQTKDLKLRLVRHNSGRVKSTNRDIHWTIRFAVAFPTRSEAMILENRIKKRGAKRYLEDIGM